MTKFYLPQCIGLYHLVTLVLLTSSETPKVPPKEPVLTLKTSARQELRLGIMI